MNKQTYILIAASIVCLIIGFIAGRKTIKEVVREEQVQGETFAGSIPVTKPVKEEMTETQQLPMKPVIIIKDSIEYRYLEVDTAAIIAEYELKRSYRELLFDNDKGRLELNLTTQYNKLTGLDYSFTPIHTVRTLERKRAWTPFVSASYNTLNYLSAGGGVFYHDVGLQLRYITNFKVKGLDIGVMYKF